MIECHFKSLKKEQKKEIYFWKKTQNIFIFSAYTDAFSSSSFENEVN